MEKTITIKRLHLLLLLAAIIILVFVISKQLSQSNITNASGAQAKNCECGAEYIIRTYAVQNKTAKQLYQDLYKTPPVNGKSGLAQCPA